MIKLPASKFMCALSCLLLVGCHQSLTTSRNSVSDSRSDNQELIVSAAVSLRDAFGEIGKLYEQRTGRRVLFNFGASGALQRQLESGAPSDLFASAALKQMDELADKKLIVMESRRNFAHNTMVLITPHDSKLDITSFAGLADAKVEKIAIGNPKTVPAGEYAQQLLNNLSPQLEGRLIYGEDVRQVLDYVVRGEVDAGIVYASDVRTVEGRVRVAARADESLHKPILYPIAIVRDSRRQAAARGFIELVMDAEGQSILRRNGFEGAR